MNKNNLIFTIAFFGVLLIVAAVWRQSSSASFSNDIQTDPTPTGDYLLKARARSNADRLENLLSSDAVTVAEANLLASPSEQAKTIRVRLETDTAAAHGDSALEAARPAKISILTAKSSGGVVARMRSLELSPTLIFIASLDERKNLIWWTTAPDPRLFRAETADETGKLSGETKYLENAEMLFSIPDDAKIREIRFYHPQWNGAEYDLQPLGGVSLASK